MIDAIRLEGKNDADDKIWKINLLEVTTIFVIKKTEFYFLTLKRIGSFY